MTTTGLVKRPTFEEAIAYKNPTVQIPSRTAWYARNSIQLSQFDGTHEEHDRGLLRQIEEQQEEAQIHQDWHLRYQREGFAYSAQGPGGPPPPVPPDIGNPGHQDRADEASAAALMEDLESEASGLAQQQAMGQQPPPFHLSADDQRLFNPSEFPGDAAALGGMVAGGLGRLGWAAARRAPRAIMGLASATGAAIDGAVSIGGWLVSPRDRDSQEAHARDLERRTAERDAAAARISSLMPVRSEPSSSSARSQYGVETFFLPARRETSESGGSVRTVSEISQPFSQSSQSSNGIVRGRVREIEARIPGIDRRPRRTRRSGP